MLLTSKVACSSSLGHSVEGEFLGFLYTLPSSSISDDSGSSQSSSSSSVVGVVVMIDAFLRVLNVDTVNNEMYLNIYLISDCLPNIVPILFKINIQEI